MNQVDNRPLWFAGVAALRDVARLHDLGVTAVVFLATDVVEIPAREMIVCRVPLVDGAGNEPWQLRLAIDITASLVQNGAATLVCCSNGMSRSPAVVAAALARLEGGAIDEHLKRLTHNRAADVSPALWQDIRRAAVEAN